MPEFLVREDGLLTESKVHELAAWYSERSDTDELTYEAQLMLLRAYMTLASGSQFASQGGLSRARNNVLRILCQAANGRAFMTEIVEELNVTPTNITKLVDGLAADGLVRRVGDPTDKRRTWVEITDAGQAAFNAALPATSETTRSLWSGLTRDEKRLLIHLLAKLRLTFLTMPASKAVSSAISAPITNGAAPD
jgi:MarR family 2-MHQ and catechol resistance regulon transcriptional repressor